MRWFRTRTLAQGVLGEIQETGGLTVNDLRKLVQEGRTRLLVHIDPKISPWVSPKAFALSPAQALTLMDAYEKAPEVKVQYLLRSDGTIAIVRRDDADLDDGCLHAGGPPPLP